MIHKKLFYALLNKEKSPEGTETDGMLTCKPFNTILLNKEKSPEGTETPPFIGFYSSTLF